MSAAGPLQNRVDPHGELVATSARGALMGNRGGRFHRADRTLSQRRWASRQWIACLCAFKGRHRAVWGEGYTELFFLDEVTALAAGHRPCFECRRADANAFRAAFGGDARPSAPEMDVVLHRERLDGRNKRVWETSVETLPDGAMIDRDGRPFALCGEAMLPWSFSGYGAPLQRPAAGLARVLTPPSIVRALAAGYRPGWAARASDEAGRSMNAGDRHAHQ
jgi:hypothetical protein